MRNIVVFSSIFLLFGSLNLWFLVGCSFESDQQGETDPEALFTFEVLPLLEAKCFSCHGQDSLEIEGELDLRSRESMLAGGVSGQAAVIPGNPQKSLLYQAIQRLDPEFEMPPKVGDRLNEEEIALFHDWIAGGAPWPDKAQQEKIMAEVSWKPRGRMQVQTSGGLSTSWDNRRYNLKDLWAYLPLEEPEIPRTHEKEKTNPIDAFINEKLDAIGLMPASKADKSTLIRRATFDLTGLPPSPEEIATFQNDKSPDAFEKVIDRLLASPHYGEQWARHWLDIVRYADSGGFSNDYIRPNAWRYRDYVIRSFNEDKAYDQFVREQLAGDEIDPGNPEMLIATGFLRMGPWEHTAMSVAAETRQFFLDDVTNIVGETFLSTPLSCAKCHDHKYDPIPAKDYYRIQAVFATTQFADRPAAFLPSENVQLPNFESERIARWIEETTLEQKELVDKEETAARSWYRERGLPYLAKRARRKLPDDQQPPRYYGLTNQDLGYRKVLSKRKQTLQRIQERFQPLAYSVYNGPNRVVFSRRTLYLPEKIEGEPTPTYLLDGGSVYGPKERVEPGVLSVLENLQTATDGANQNSVKSLIPNSMEGRRLAFAQWLTQKNHPITSRSIVNRVWQYHFGKGLAANPNNFGATGKKPTHPELLDWLAIYLVKNNWSLKSLHKLIMRSDAYQRSAYHPKVKRLQTLDPDNDLLAIFSPRRLEAEEIRDAMLYLSGELNLEIGGFPIRPEVNPEVAFQPRHIMGSISQAYQPSRTPEERHRRSIYAERYRSMPDPLLEVFNHPGADLSCEGRVESTVTPQVFTLFNSMHTRDRALALANQLMKEEEEPEKCVEAAIELICNRKAESDEKKKGTAFLAKMSRYHQENEPEKQAYPTSIKREMFEEMTGESFSYSEKLDIYNSFIPDLKTWEVEPETRALADFVAVLFNTNEFIYVY